jgi:hypothetical protein
MILKMSRLMSLKKIAKDNEEKLLELLNKEKDVLILN